MKAALFLTSECNLSCSYCYAAGCSTGGMAPATLSQSLRFLQNHAQGPFNLTLLGGEPLLRPDLLSQVLDACATPTDAPIRLAIASNGTLLTAALLDQFQARGIELQLSLDGVRAAHDKHRRTPAGAGSFDQVLARVPELLAHLPCTPVTMVVTPATVESFAESIQFLDQLGFRDLRSTLAYEQDWRQSDLDRLAGHYQRAAALYLDRMRAGARIWWSFLDDPIKIWTSAGRAGSACCDLAGETLAIGPSGTLYPCVQMVGRDDGTLAIGHVETGLDRAACARIREQASLDAPDCAACALRARCFHRCGCLNWRCSGALNLAPASLCGHERMAIPLADAVATALFREANPAFLRKFYDMVSEVPLP